MHLAAIGHQPYPADPEHNRRWQAPEQERLAVTRRDGVILQVERQNECGNKPGAYAHHF